MNLADYIQQYLTTPFAWGQHDCVLFTVRWQELASGKTYLPEKLWTSEKTALARLKKEGGLVAALDKHFKRIEPNYAMDGDIAFRAGNALLFTGAQIAGIGPEGLVFHPRKEAEYAWTH